MASQETVFIIPGGNPGKMSYILYKPCNWFFGSIIVFRLNVAEPVNARWQTSEKQPFNIKL
jgi:hypothetical protein